MDVESVAGAWCRHLGEVWDGELLGSIFRGGENEEEAGGLEAKSVSTGTGPMSCAHFTDGETEA